jgi:hypothetical protein
MGLKHGASKTDGKSFITCGKDFVTRPKESLEAQQKEQQNNKLGKTE